VGDEKFRLEILGGPSKRNKFHEVMAKFLCKFDVVLLSMWFDWNKTGLDVVGRLQAKIENFVAKLVKQIYTSSGKFHKVEWKFLRKIVVESRQQKRSGIVTIWSTSICRNSKLSLHPRSSTSPFKTKYFHNDDFDSSHQLLPQLFIYPFSIKH
jgi:hypothetical protein